MKPKLLILGAGMYGSVVKEIAEATGTFETIDFLDDCFEKKSDAFHEEPIGKLNDFQTFAGKYEYAIVAIGNPDIRKEWTNKLLGASYRIPVLISPAAYVSPSAQLQYGVVVEPKATVMANTVIGACTFVSAGAVVNHNVFVGDFCHIDCNAVVLGGAFVANASYIDACEVIRKAPMKFTLDQDGIHAEKLPITPTGKGWNFDDVM